MEVRARKMLLGLIGMSAKSQRMIKLSNDMVNISWLVATYDRTSDGPLFPPDPSQIQTQPSASASPPLIPYNPLVSLVQINLVT